MLAGTILAFGSARKLCSSNNLTEYSIQLQHITKCAPCQIPGWRGRYLEIRLPVSGLERYPACHPERSEGSLRPSSQTLRCAQGDRPYLPMFGKWLVVSLVGCCFPLLSSEYSVVNFALVVPW